MSPKLFSCFSKDSSTDGSTSRVRVPIYLYIDTAIKSCEYIFLHSEAKILIGYKET